MATAAQLATVSAIPTTDSRSHAFLKLNKRQKAFIDDYLQHHSARHAAISLGCAEKNASTQGMRMIRKAHIKAAIDAEMEILAERNNITTTYVLNGIRAIVEDESTRRSDKLQGYEMLGKWLKMWRDQLDVNITHDLADRVAQARQRVTNLVPVEIHGTLEK